MGERMPPSHLQLAQWLFRSDIKPVSATCDRLHVHKTSHPAIDVGPYDTAPEAADHLCQFTDQVLDPSCGVAWLNEGTLYARERDR